jgi:penicillin-binding protein 1C
MRLKKAVVFFAVLCCLTIVFAILDWLYPVDLYPRSTSQVVLAEDGTVLRAFADNNGVWRYAVDLDDVSKNYIEALIGYEDRYFYYHPGINPYALGRAAWLWMKNGYIVSGGSTLTMQVARIRYPHSRSIAAKLIQILRALQLEWHYSKNEILTFYLNHAPFGGAIEGVQAASFSYFGHSAKHLTDAQAALLAVLPQAPSRYRPDKHPHKAKQARDKLLHRLVDLNIWTNARSDDAKLENVIAEPMPHYQWAPLLARRLAIGSGKGRIQTFVNSNWQRQIENKVRQYVKRIDQHVSAAVLIVENKTGKIRSYIGSADFNDDNRFAHVDMIKAIRSPGSTLKPFIYAMGIDNGLIHSQSLLMDVPLRFGDYQPSNFSGGFSGPVSMSNALKQSLNIPAVQVMERLGPVAFYIKMQKAGIPLYLPKKAKPNLAIALGGVGATLEDLVSAYTSLANQGKSQRLRFSADDEQVQSSLISEGAAWIIRKSLIDNKLGGNGVVVKTGTSYGFRDAWAIGLTQNHTIGVWVGHPDGTPLTGHYGRVTAVPLFKVITQLINDSGHQTVMPKQVSETEICWPQGDVSGEKCDQKKRAYILDKTVPKTWYSTLTQNRPFTDSDFIFWQATDTKLRVTPECDIPFVQKKVRLWPAPLEPWLEQKHRRERKIPSWDPRCSIKGNLPQQRLLKIQGVRQGDAFQVNSNLDFNLHASAQGGDGPFFWFLNGDLLLESTKKIKLSNLHAGQYQLTLMDQTGATDNVDFKLLYMGVPN